MPVNASLPTLVIFGLDYTLWPFWVDVGFFLPFSKRSSGQVVDAKGTVLKCFKEVPLIFETLTNEGVQIAVTSLTSTKRRARQVLRLLGLHDYISYISIDHWYKNHQVEEIHLLSGINYTDMLFFDDGLGAINDVSPLGVLSIHIKHGMNMRLLDYGLRLFKNKMRKRKRKRQ